MLNDGSKVSNGFGITWTDRMDAFGETLAAGHAQDSDCTSGFVLTRDGCQPWTVVKPFPYSAMGMVASNPAGDRICTASGLTDHHVYDGKDVSAQSGSTKDSCFNLATMTPSISLHVSTSSGIAWKLCYKSPLQGKK